MAEAETRSALPPNREAPPAGCSDPAVRLEVRRGRAEDPPEKSSARTHNPVAGCSGRAELSVESSDLAEARAGSSAPRRGGIAASRRRAWQPAAGGPGGSQPPWRRRWDPAAGCAGGGSQRPGGAGGGSQRPGGGVAGNRPGASSDQLSDFLGMQGPEVRRPGPTPWYTPERTAESRQSARWNRGIGGVGGVGNRPGGIGEVGGVGNRPGGVGGGGDVGGVGNRPGGVGGVGGAGRRWRWRPTWWSRWRRWRRWRWQPTGWSRRRRQSAQPRRPEFWRPEYRRPQYWQPECHERQRGQCKRRQLSQLRRQ